MSLLGLSIGMQMAERERMVAECTDHHPFAMKRIGKEPGRHEERRLVLVDYHCDTCGWGMGYDRAGAKKAELLWPPWNAVFPWPAVKDSNGRTGNKL